MEREREEADRVRRIKPRRQGKTTGKYLSIGLVVPTPLIREVAGTDETGAAWERWQDYEFEVELTDEGILYRPLRLSRETGWGK